MVTWMSKQTSMLRQWDEAKYPPRRPLKETVEAITDIVTQLEDQLKVRSPHRHWLSSQSQHRMRLYRFVS